MFQEILVFVIVGIALLITIIHFVRKYIRIKKNESTCGTCSSNGCDGCALKKIKEAKK